MKEDYSIPLLFAFIIFWIFWYRMFNDFWLSGGITIVLFILGKIIYKVWNLTN